ncbi:hypothetical protein NBRC111894_114 [Sporolactobacillus inulinus]|uniref:Uncharacterized protein n=1 Tax=Sporolactobacillus inulinus TaxID=2078 RepID=A0A4Y1Z6B1_9BACL|nr:hypothetical protein NBRC111894_114 [Sporolactobacillus inulinus]
MTDGKFFNLFKKEHVEVLQRVIRIRKLHLIKGAIKPK